MDVDMEESRLLKSKITKAEFGDPFSWGGGGGWDDGGYRYYFKALFCFPPHD